MFINIEMFFTFTVIWAVVMTLTSLWGYKTGRIDEKNKQLGIELENKYLHGENERMRRELIESGVKSEDDFELVEVPDDRANGDYKGEEL